MKHVISSGGIISTIVNNKLYILFITARNGLLTFPKGHVAKNEIPSQTAIREIKEEIGLKSVRIISKLGVICRQGTEHDGSTSRKDVHLFLMKASGYTYCHEEDFVWIEYNKALKCMNKMVEKRFLKQNKKIIEKNTSSYFAKFLQTNKTRNDDLDINDNFKLSKELGKYAENGDNIFQINSNDVKPGNIINSDLPEKIDIFYADNSLNLSDTKTFFLINEVLKKMKIGGYFIISGKTKNYNSIKQGKKLGQNIFLDNKGVIIRAWNEQFIKNSLVKKLKLKLIKIKKIKNKVGELLYFIAQKKFDYAY